MKYILLTIIICFWPFSAYSQGQIDSVLVKKSEKKMYLLKEGNVVKEYKISLGANPKGHKEQEGDEKTPEGKYILDYKKKDSAFYKAIHISYPSSEDIQNAKKRNVNPGGQIMIHGQKNGYGKLAWLTQKFNWTDGCIAVTNKEMEEIWNLIEVNTPIIIEK
jgi:murein L,D-transpeptidase YafK